MMQNGSLMQGLRRTESCNHSKTMTVAAGSSWLLRFSQLHNSTQQGAYSLLGVSAAQLLHAQLGKFERGQALAASQAASAPLNPVQCSQVKDYAHDAVREQVPGLLAASISNHVPPMVDEVSSANRDTCCR